MAGMSALSFLRCMMRCIYCLGSKQLLCLLCYILPEGNSSHRHSSPFNKYKVTGMVALFPRFIHLHSTHNGAVSLLSIRGIGHGGTVFDRFIFIHQLPKISRQIRGTSSNRSSIRPGIMAIRKQRLVSFFMSVVCSEIACENFSLTLPACFSRFFAAH